MKKYSLIVMLCLILGHVQNTRAQMVAPSNTDDFWATVYWAPNNVVNGVNTALIDYPITPNTRGQLAVCAYGATPGTAGAADGGFVIRDLTHNIGLTLSYPLFGPLPGPIVTASVPDIIIGNSALYDSTFVVAMAYVDNYNQVRIDFYDVVLYGSPLAYSFSSSLAYHSSIIMPTLGCEVPMGTVHIDIVADYSNLVYGRPICHKFFVTYDASASCPPGGQGIYAAYGDLSTYSLITGPVYIPGFTGADNQTPDVAGVQIPAGGGGGKDIARIAYKSSSSTAIYEYDWNPTVPPSTGGIPLATSLTYTYEEPRIDAIDDFANSTSGVRSHYKVVCGGFDPVTGYYHSVSSDDMDIPGTVVSSWVDFTSCPTSPYTTFAPPVVYNHYLPTVAYGSESGHQYMINEGFSEGGSNGDFFVMCPVDYTVPGSVAPDLTSANSYFLLNTGYPLNSTPTRYTNAVSTPCNAVEDTSVVTWTYYDAGLNYYMMMYKRSAYDYGSSTGYSYRPGTNNISDIAAVSGQERTKDVALFPNPAQDDIYIRNVEGNYSIKNMLGQDVTKGELQRKVQRIDIHDLSPGTYIFSCVSPGMPPLNKVFTKN